MNEKKTDNLQDTEQPTEQELKETAEEASTELAPTIESLSDELEVANAKIGELEERLLRAQADLDNVRRRAATDVSKAHQYGLEKFAKELLAAIDSLEHAQASHAAHAKEIDSDVMQSLQDGIALTLKMFVDTFEKFDIKLIDPQNEPFDAHLHEAISMQETTDAAPNTVLQVIQKGYQLNDRLLRPARVIIAREAVKP